MSPKLLLLAVLLLVAHSAVIADPPAAPAAPAAPAEPVAIPLKAAAIDPKSANFNALLEFLNK